jgi:hypothetical protein
MARITLHTAQTAHLPPDHVMQVATMVRALSNKYIPAFTIDKVEIDLLQSLKDFCHCTRKRAGDVRLRKNQPRTTHYLDDSSNLNKWHKVEQVEVTKESNECYGLGSSLYDTITAHPEVNSGHNRLEHFLDKLEMELVGIISSLIKNDTRNIPKQDQDLA